MTGAAARRARGGRGLRCPPPHLALAPPLRGRRPPGGLVELLADDPAAAPDLAAWCRMRGQELVTSDPPRFVVRRTLP